MCWSISLIIYKDCYFTEKVGCLTVKNEEDVAGSTLMSVDLQSKGRFINLSNEILREGNDIYKKEDRDAGCISYRRDCDGICLLELNGRNILLVIEVKSGFNEVKKKGFEQLVASYVKIRGILQSIEGYNPAEYEEIGLLVSYPPGGNLSIPKTNMIGIKKDRIAPTVLDRLNNINSTKLRVDNEIMLELNDYKVDACHVNPAMYNRQLRVKHVSVPNQVSSETIDLDSYL